jgi:hypothetical protein
MDALASPTPAAPVPTLVRRWAYAALVPFVMSALLAWLVWPDTRYYVAHALSAYAGVVVSVLCGVHWGLSMKHAEVHPRRFAASGLLALGAWIGLVMPPESGLVFQGAMLVGGYLVDRKVYPAAGLSAWMTLRFRLAAIAALCCFIAAAGA